MNAHQRRKVRRQPKRDAYLAAQAEERAKKEAKIKAITDASKLTKE